MSVSWTVARGNCYVGGVFVWLRTVVVEQHTHTEHTHVEYLIHDSKYLPRGLARITSD